MALTGIDESAVDDGISSVDKNENQTERTEEEASEKPNSTEKVISLTNSLPPQPLDERTQDHPVQSTDSAVPVSTPSKFDPSVTVDIPLQPYASVSLNPSSVSQTGIPASTPSTSQTSIAASTPSTSQTNIVASTPSSSQTNIAASAESQPEKGATDTPASSANEVSSSAQAEDQGIANSTSRDDIASGVSKPDPVKSALVSKVLKKAREAAEGDQRSTGSTAYSGDQRSTGATRLPDQRTTGSSSSTRLPDQRTTGATPKQDQKSTGSTSSTSSTRLPDQSTTGATRFTDQRSTGSTRFTDQKSTGSTRFNDQRNTGATPRISDQRSTGATPSYNDYNDISTTGTFKSLIGRPPLDGTAKAGEQSDTESDENAPERSRKSLAATIETEAQKKCKTSLLEKVVTKHPILIGSAAFLVFVVPIYLFIVNSQSPAERAEYKSSWGKDVKIIASKLGKPGEYKGHKVSFYANRADVYMKSAEYQSAISDLKIARQIDLVKAVDYNLKLSSCYLAVKDYKNASLAAADALKDDSTNVDALLLHARASYLFGNKLTALDDYFKAAKLDPSNPRLFIERGDYYVAEKKAGSAAADYKHALELAPSLAEAKQKLAACTAMVSTHQSSTSSSEAADQSTKLSPAAKKVIAESDFATLRNKGYEALKKGDNLFAIAALSRAVSLNPNGALVRQYLAHALLANDDFAEAATQFNAWDKIATLKLPEKLAFLKRFPTSNNPSAGALYSQLIEQYSADGDALVSIANACKTQGYQEQFEAAVASGLKVGTPAQVTQLTTMKVVSHEEAKVVGPKAVIAN
jgi:Tfp pilus assembly protein PilF